MEERIKQLEETVETLKINIELLLNVATSVKLNGRSLYEIQLKKMIKERN